MSPCPPPPVSSARYPFPTAGATPYRGGYLYATDYHSGLVVYDVNNPADPVYIKRIATPFLTNDIAVSGGYAYVADEAQGAMGYNLMDPVSIFSDISIPFGNGERLCATDKGLFSANESYGAAFCDIGNPNDPASVKTFDFGSKTSRGITTAGNYAFVNNHRYEGWQQQLSVAIIDVGRVAAPFLLTELDTAKQEGDIYSNGIAVSGAYLYQAVGDGLRIFSLRP